MIRAITGIPADVQFSDLTLIGNQWERRSERTIEEQLDDLDQSLTM